MSRAVTGSQDMIALDRAFDAWEVIVRERRIVFVNGASAIEIPVDGPLRWARDGAELSFDQAIAAVPAELHGWMSLAALIALRHSLGGLVAGCALPPGYHEWAKMGRRCAPLAAWMEGLARLDHVSVPDLPDGVDDGLGEALDA